LPANIRLHACKPEKAKYLLTPAKRKRAWVTFSGDIATIDAILPWDPLAELSLSFANLSLMSGEQRCLQESSNSYSTGIS
jgi:hypothetical protein